MFLSIAGGLVVLFSHPVTIHLAFIVIFLYVCRLKTSADGHQSTSARHRLREPISFSFIEPLRKDELQLVWIDCRCSDNYLGPLLRQLNPSSRFFTDLTPAVEYLSNNEGSLQLIVVVSGEYSEEIVQLSEHLSQIRSLFIYCFNLAKYQYLKKDSSKLLDICDDPLTLISSIQKTLESLSITTSRQYSMRDLNKHSATFIWFQLLKSLLAELTTRDEKMAMNDLKEVIENYGGYLKVTRATLLEEISEYDPDHAVYWYSRNISLSSIINDALRRQDIDFLYKCRHFIRDLSNRLSGLRQELITPLTVYRGAILSKEIFNELKHAARQGGFVSTFGYLSTSNDPQVAKTFGTLPDRVTDMDGAVSVSFEIEIGSNAHVIAGDISRESAFSQETEVLFDIDSTFEILDMNVNEAQQSCTIRMRTSPHGSELTSEYLRYNETQLDRLSVEILFGRLIADMGEFEKSVRYFERLVDKQNIDQVHVRVNLGRAYALAGDHKNAKKYYDAARDLETDANSLKMADIIHKLGLLDNTLGDYKAAIENYRKSLKLYSDNQSSGFWEIKGDLHTNLARAQTSLGHFAEAKRELESSYTCMTQAGIPRDHADFSQHQINFGKICQSEGKYVEAEQYYKTALEMRKRTLPPGHLDIGKTLFSLGSTIGEYGKDYERALVYFRESLVITETAVGKYHPTTALVLSGIANVYLCRNELDQASIYQFRVVELYEEIYDKKDHEDIARTLNNIGELSRRQGNFEQAFLYFDKALQMRRRVLPDDHYDIGTVHVNLAETYRDVGDYQTAMQHAQTGLDLWRKKLVVSATYMKEAEDLLVELRELLSSSELVVRKDKQNTT